MTNLTVTKFAVVISTGQVGQLGGIFSNHSWTSSVVY